MKQSHNPLNRLRAWYQSRFGTALPPEIRHARALIAAIDAGGIPLNPLRVNTIARALGLEVSRQAPVEETIARIRAALERV
ncbi:MAG: hypothetical protein WAZ34_00580 [Rhodocyclaceae bacterium]